MERYRRLVFEDYNQTCKDLALNLLGKILVRNLNNTLMKGKIVETECYLGGEDKASHSFNNRKTPANEPMYMPAGTAYVYMTYGMYHCFNISSKEPGAAVLLRALEPLEGQNEMEQLRKEKNKNIKHVKDLCNGPAKLCLSLNITKNNCNKINLATSDELWIEDNPDKEENIVISSSRIGIASAGEEWAKKKLRFYTYGNVNVSKRDKEAESNINIT